ncbi:hypothetical protein [Chromobacterium violaceum]|uniref:hypothetical protein n=1 Tax=Chromobacterium violaceum TaxID=536 RepID=UPI00143D71C7|nr:hypothetical protein [Chromobacterium violaceum]QIY79329.1 hypothetical protein FOB43_09060 [Chromobacterium violaceum]
MPFAGFKSSSQPLGRKKPSARPTSAMPCLTFAGAHGTPCAASPTISAGMQRGWHDVYARFGANTLKTFGAPSEPGVRLGTTSSSSTSGRYGGNGKATAAIDDGRRTWVHVAAV